MCWTALSSLNHLTSHHKARWSNCSLQATMASVRFWRALLFILLACRTTSLGACLGPVQREYPVYRKILWLLCALEDCSACSYANFGEPGVPLIKLALPFCVWVVYYSTWGMQCGFRSSRIHTSLTSLGKHAPSSPHIPSIMADVQPTLISWANILLKSEICVYHMTCEGNMHSMSLLYHMQTPPTPL